MINEEDRNYPTYTSKFPELGFYAFPGAASDTRGDLEQVKHAEQLGIGNVMISERADFKEIGTLCGAVAAVTEEIYIGTSATNANTRHPMYTAALCSSMNRMSRGRFALGLGKGNAHMMRRWGMKPVTFAHEREYYDVIRRMLSGEIVQNYSGSIGEFPQLGYSDYVREDVPILFVGFGPQSLKHAGTVYDGAHLHTFMSPAAVARAVGLVREGEREAGKEVGRAKVWTVLATLCNPTEQKYLEYVTARLAQYLQVPGYGEGLAKINGWDMEQLAEFRQQPAMTSVKGWIDSVASFEQFAAIDKVLPQEWRSAAIGTPKECAERWLEEFEAGADGIIIHTCTPEEFEPVLAEYEKMRPNHLFQGRTNRPA